VYANKNIIYLLFAKIAFNRVLDWTALGNRTIWHRQSNIRWKWRLSESLKQTQM